MLNIALAYAIIKVFSFNNLRKKKRSGLGQSLGFHLGSVAHFVVELMRTN